MNIIQIFQKFPTQESCVIHIEQVRWNGQPVCVYCGGDKVSKHTEAAQQSRWQCSHCRKSFSATVGTIFHHTHMPLQKWFLAISLILNAKKGISSRQLARDLELPVKTAWSVAHRIRKAMKDDGTLLTGIVEMDECYIGGNPRPMNDKDDNTPPPGPSGSKIPVVGIVERKGRVKATKISKYDINARTMIELVRSGVDTSASKLLTDEHYAYNKMKNIMPHSTVSHSRKFSDCLVNTNSIESFWAIVKRGIVGQFHKVSDKYLDAYLNEFCYRYNGRDTDGGVLFDRTVCRMLGV